MFDFDHDAETATESPNAGELLAEVGLDPRAIAEILARPDAE